jgi:hypothetical protein
MMTAAAASARPCPYYAAAFVNNTEFAFQNMTGIEDDKAP